MRAWTPSASASGPSGAFAGGEVVAGQGARQLVGAEGFEESGGGEMADLAVAPGEGVVGDLPDERLDERVLAALRRTGVGLEGQQLPANEVTERVGERRRVAPAHRGESRDGEALAEHGGILHEAPGRRQGVEPRGDERRQCLGHGERVRSPTGR